MILPTPGRGFAWRQTHRGPALVCLPLEQVAPHLFTVRSWEPIDAPCDEPDIWTKAAEAIGLPPSRLAKMKQVHGHTVTRATRETAGHRPEADIAICDDPTLGLAVQAADCVPLLVADRRKGVVAAAHAGWRGLAQGVPQMTVQALVAEFRSSPADLVVAIGPSVGACCYEVGADVRREFETHSEGRSGHTRWFHDGPRVIPGNPSMPDLRTTRREGHAFFDGWAAAEDQLRASGVPAASIFMAELCTASHANWFWSYRREGSQAKRLVGAIRAAASGTRPSAA